jgi:hypothetical protein
VAATIGDLKPADPKSEAETIVVPSRVGLKIAVQAVAIRPDVDQRQMMHVMAEAIGQGAAVRPLVVLAAAEASALRADQWAEVPASVQDRRVRRAAVTGRWTSGSAGWNKSSIRF